MMKTPACRRSRSLKDQTIHQPAPPPKPSSTAPFGVRPAGSPSRPVGTGWSMGPHAGGSASGLEARGTACSQPAWSDALWFAPHGVNGIRPPDRVAVERLSSEGSGDLATLNARRPGLEVEDEVGLAVVVDVLEVPLLVCRFRTLGAEADARGVDGGGVEGVGGQDGDPDNPVVLGPNPTSVL